MLIHSWCAYGTVEQKKTTFRTLFVLLLPIYIKLGLVKNIVKEGTSKKVGIRRFLKYLKEIFLQLSDGKLKLCIVIEPQIKKLLGISVMKN